MIRKFIKEGEGKIAIIVHRSSKATYVLYTENPSIFIAQ